MESKIAKALKLQNEAVAIYHADELPEGAMQFKEGRWGCVAAMLNAASKGRMAAFCDKTLMCLGGRANLGMEPYKPGWIEKFLSDGEGLEREGERYKKTEALALEFIQTTPFIKTDKYLVFKPLSQVGENDPQPEAVVFMVEPDRLSALATLANFDTNESTVKVEFAAGCAQSVLFPLKAQEDKSGFCYIGLTDLSARKCIDKNIMSFGIPYHRFLEMEDNVEISFFTTETWEIISKRL